MSDFTRNIQLDTTEGGYDGSVDVESNRHGDLYMTATLVNASGSSGTTLTLEPDQAREIADALYDAAGHCNHLRVVKERGLG